MGVALCGLRKIYAGLVGYRREPGEDVSELDPPVEVITAEERPRQLADLFYEPREGAFEASLVVTFAIGLAHEALELSDVHTRYLTRPAFPAPA